jgi:hypothetical protein
LSRRSLSNLSYLSRSIALWLLPVAAPPAGHRLRRCHCRLRASRLPSCTALLASCASPTCSGAVRGGACWHHHAPSARGHSVTLAIHPCATHTADASRCRHRTTACGAIAVRCSQARSTPRHASSSTRLRHALCVGGCDGDGWYRTATEALASTCLHAGSLVQPRATRGSGGVGWSLGHGARLQQPSRVKAEWLRPSAHLMDLRQSACGGAFFRSHLPSLPSRGKLCSSEQTERPQWLLSCRGQARGRGWAELLSCASRRERWGGATVRRGASTDVPAESDGGVCGGRVPTVVLHHPRGGDSVRSLPSTLCSHSIFYADCGHRQ